jgi:hypothetical protein
MRNRCAFEVIVARLATAIEICVAFAACAGNGLPTSSAAALPAMRGSFTSASAANSTVTCRGVDDSAALQARLERGSTTIVASGTCAIRQTLRITSPDTFLRGVPGTTVNGAFVAKAILKWTGPANGTILVMVGTGHELQGGGISNIGFDSGNGSASIGLDLEGVEGATFSNIAANEFNDAAIALGQTQNGLNTMNNLFSNYALTNTLNSGAGVLIDTPCGVWENERREMACWARRDLSYYNQFVSGIITVDSGIGIDALTSDGNLFQGVRIAEAASAGGVWQGVGVFFGCDSVSNHVQGLSFTANETISGPSWNIVALGSYADRKATNDLLDVCKYNANSATPYTTASYSDSVQGYAENGNVASAPLSGTVKGGHLVCVKDKCTNYGAGDYFWCTTDLKVACGFQTATDPGARRFLEDRFARLEALQMRYASFARSLR